MELSKRQQKIVEILSKEEDYITVKALAEKLNISPRTIYYDLDVIESNQSLKDFVVEKKPGTGVRAYWKQTVTNLITKQDAFDQRFNQIFKQVVIDQKTVTVKKLADQFYVSSSSIVEELNKLEELLKPFSQIRIISDKNGTRISGSEYQIQQLILSFNNKILESLGQNATIYDFADSLSSFYTEEIIQAALNIEQDLADYKLKIKAPYYAFNILSLVIVMIYRMKSDHHISVEELRISGKNIYAMNNYMIAWEILDRMTQRVHFTFDEAEIYTLSMYLHGNRLESQDITMENHQLYKNIATELVDRMSIAINEDLRNDRLLLNNLTLHLYHMTYRLENDIIIQNPLLPEIMRDFRLMYDLVWIMLDTEKHLLSVKITEDEVGFLLLHFQSALDRAERSKMIYIVCHQGYVSQEFTINRVRKYVSPLDIIKVVTPEEFLNTDLDQIDFIISTTPLEAMTIPYVLVSPLITDEDMLVIAKKYQEVMTKSSKDDDKTFVDYLSKNYFYYNKNAKNKEEIINHILDDLISNKIVEEAYRASVWLREREGTTSLGKGVAIPHGSISYVNKTCIPVWINKTPIKWGDSEVQIIFLYAIAKEDLNLSKDIIKSLLTFVRGQENLLQKIKIMDEATFYEFLSGGNDYD